MTEGQKTDKECRRSCEPEPVWNFLGLKIGRKTEIIALIAFVLSVSGLLWQVRSYTRGAVVNLFPTDQILITSTDKLGRNYSGQINYLAVAATMSYANDGDIGHNAIIRREYIAFSLGDRDIEHRGYEFGTFDIKGGAPEFVRKSESRPTPVNAGSAESHETLFAAWEIDCENAQEPCDSERNFVTWVDFIKAIKAKKQISFTTSADIYSSKRVNASCVVRLRSWESEILESEQWLAPTCTDVSVGGRPQRKVQPQQPTSAPK